MEKHKNTPNGGRRKRRGSKGLVLWACIPLLAAALVLFLHRPPAPLPGKAPQAHAAGEAWSLLLVNEWNPVPEGYDVELEQLSNGEQVDKRIYPPLQEMFDAARAEGVYPVVVSGYRTAETQQKIMDEKIAEYKAMGYSSAQARAEAKAWVAQPGASEHQLGLAVDINADGIHSAGNEVYRWLDKNSHRFGFIRRYPPDKIKTTGVSHEPWHYRYVGVAAATEMHRKNLCLEEYLNTAEKIKEANG